MSKKNGKPKEIYDPTELNDHLDNMYQEWFLDYASYVILERAVPTIEDGLKPVQRRILHAMREMDDGRFHKVANVIGQTMQYHPHGDAAIGDALVHIGQKDLLLDTQGNWGDIRTGDPSAAPRYIETRLSKFALDVAFNPETTEWQASYDGRKNEPVNLPVKFPLLLAQGVEGIAVGLSTKIMPHNFNELIDSSIKVLQGKRTKLLPDFPTGGMADVSDYNGGMRGGKIKVRAKIEALDKKTLIIRELPYGVTTSTLIDSIIKANDKGKIKIKKVTDNTAKHVEIVVELPGGVTTDKAIDALYAFTKCEESISPLTCVIINEKPHFLDVNELLKISTDNTVELLKRELEIKGEDLALKWHQVSLEKIFIENRIYRDIEECETWEAVLQTIDKGLHKYVSTPSKKNTKKTAIKLSRDVTEEDIVRLTEIKIKRISKYDSFKTLENLKKLEEGIKQVKHDLKHLTDFAINYFKELKAKYGKGRERKTELTEFGTIDTKAVAASNVKFYVNRKEGFIGTSLRRDEYLFDCSDIDDVIVIRRDGKCLVTRVDSKTFVGKSIEYIGLWKRGDDRTTYNFIYTNSGKGVTYVKRFNIPSVTYDREYDIVGKAKRCKIQYLTANPNAEAEVVGVQLSPESRAKKKTFDFDFAQLDVKSRSARGNILTKYPVRKVTLKEVGQSTIGGMHLWVDEGTGRVNNDEYGTYLGEFFGDEQYILLNKDGTYQIRSIEVGSKLDIKEAFDHGILNADTTVSAIYYDDKKKAHYIKRFQIETNTLDTKFNYIGETEKNTLLFASLSPFEVSFTYARGRAKERTDELINVAEFIDVKGWKAQGNKLNFREPKKFRFNVLEVEENEVEEPAPERETDTKPVKKKEKNASKKDDFDELMASVKDAKNGKSKADEKKEKQPKDKKDEVAEIEWDLEKDEVKITSKGEQGALF